MDFVTAATFGCRMATAFRAVALQGKIANDQWLAVHGCGGLGLSAVMIATAFVARVIAVDINDEALVLAKQFGAEHCLNARKVADVPGAILDLTKGGVDLSIDALGSADTAANSIRCLRKRGRHVQVGLLVADDAQPRIPMELVISRELEICGSHGLAATDYPAMMQLATTGTFDPRRLVRRSIKLEEAPAALAELGAFSNAGITVIELS
jgi:alcohol dehydrogenase